jgi:hypothetical protein
MAIREEERENLKISLLLPHSIAIWMSHIWPSAKRLKGKTKILTAWGLMRMTQFDHLPPKINDIWRKFKFSNSMGSYEIGTQQKDGEKLIT